MSEITYGNTADITPPELAAFYQRLGHHLDAPPEQMRAMIECCDAFVTARSAGRLIGVARGVSDGLRGYLTECKLDPAFQGPGAVTRKDGRIEDDKHGVAAEMARRVLETMSNAGVVRTDVLAYGTEVDFLEELGFKRASGLVALTLDSAAMAHVGAPAATT